MRLKRPVIPGATDVAGGASEAIVVKYNVTIVTAYDESQFLPHSCYILQETRFGK
jgi:hypothetical protein